ncbi:unnamed protein product [Spodoptera exigua]|nr:unnamed protein product [Spodoptera exigua]
MYTSVCIVFLIIGSVICGDENQAKLRLYYDSFDNFTEVPFDEAHSLFSLSWYNQSKTTTIFCHGFTGHPYGPAVTAIIKAYLEQGQNNVALLNWDRLAAAVNGQIPATYLSRAVPNAIKVSADFADILLNLSAAGLDLNKMHLVGHSLGAQIVGMAGNKMAKKGVQLPWITGLDPAGVVFDSKPPHERLNPKSAGYVDVIHSDPNRYGSRRELGTVDFWPNYRTIGPVVQPGCDNKSHPRFSPEDLCNHHKCWQYLIDSMKYSGTLVGSHARNFRTWKNYTKPQRLANVLEIGKYYEKVTPGNYYFYTAASSPYGLAENGL